MLDRLCLKIFGKYLLLYVGVCRNIFSIYTLKDILYALGLKLMLICVNNKMTVTVTKCFGIHTYIK